MIVNIKHQFTEIFNTSYDRKRGLSKTLGFKKEIYKYSYFEQNTVLIKVFLFFFNYSSIVQEEKLLQ